MFYNIGNHCFWGFFSDHVTSIPTTVEWYGQRNECDCFECGESLESDNHNW